MALFKVMKGGKERLDSQPTRDGYAYFTTEDNGFYIDANPVNASTGESEGTVTRRKINDAANTSFAVEGFSADNVEDAITEVKTLVNGKVFTYDSTTETLTFGTAAQSSSGSGSGSSGS